LDTDRTTRFRCGIFEVQASPLEHTVACLGYRFDEDDKTGPFDVDRAEALGVKAGPLRRELQSGRSVQIGDRTIRPEQILGPPQPGRRIAYCTDTRPCDTGLELARGVDLLIHDSTFANAQAELACKTGHSTAEEAARVAEAAGALQLILWHLSSRFQGPGEESLLEEARRIFPNTDLARDLMSVRLNRCRPAWRAE
jgi:ribonuclease Z